MDTKKPSTIDQSKGTINQTFLFNSVEVRLVPFHGLDVHPVTGIALYVSSDGPYGVRVYPDGRKVQINAIKNNYGHSYVHGKEEYFRFRDAWGHHKGILASRAVYLAWYEPIKPGMTIDHIDGCTTNNDYRNLRQVTNAINIRDGGFLRKLKKVGIDPQTLQRWMILRYFDRMAELKPAITKYRYSHLSLAALRYILEAPQFSVKKITSLISGR